MKEVLVEITDEHASFKGERMSALQNWSGKLLFNLNHLLVKFIAHETLLGLLGIIGLMSLNLSGWPLSSLRIGWCIVFLKIPLLQCSKSCSAGTCMVGCNTENTLLRTVVLSKE